MHDEEALRKSFSWLEQTLTASGVSIDFPKFPDRAVNQIGPTKMRLSQKIYPSHYVPLGKRKKLKLIRDMASQCGSALKCLATVSYLKPVEGGIEVEASIGSEQKVFRVRAAIFAGGRFAPLLLPILAPDISTSFRRYEIGLRVEQPSSQFCLDVYPQVDPKLIITNRGDNVEFRTCRNGEALKSDWNGVISYSGRADGRRTGFSNFGFNVRFKDESWIQIC